MARKSIKGYAEKNYYDNTKFSGGVVATNDPLNEGYFKHLVNFDIADTGMSLMPRKGFITTTFKKDDQVHTFSNEAIYFYDENLGKYIFFDNDKGYICDFDLEEKFLTNIVEITNIDRSDIDALAYRVNINNAYGNKAIRIVDEYNVVSYILKVSLVFTSANHRKQIKPYWLKLFYRENASEYAGASYEADTLVISYLDTNQVVEYVDPNYRNLAYGGSIIPNPMQEIYTEAPDGHYDRMPMIYVKGSNGKYLINEIKNTDIHKYGFEVIPNFYIMQDDNVNYTWGYTYEITSTGDFSYEDSKNPVMYKAPIYYLTNRTYLNLYDASSYIKYITEKEYTSLINSTSFIDLYNTSTSYDNYITLINNLGFDTSTFILPEYIIYIVPIPDSTISEYTIDLSESNLLGPFGLLTHFSNSTVYFNSDQAAEGEEREVPGAEEHNKHINIYHSLLHKNYLYEHPYYYGDFHYIDTENIDTMLRDIEDLGLGIYVKKINDCISLKEHKGGFQDCIETVMSSSIYSWEDAPMTASEFKNTTIYMDVKTASKVSVRTMLYTSKVRIKTLNASEDLEKYPVLAERLFSKVFTSNATELHYWWTYDIYKIIQDNRTYKLNRLYSYDTPFRRVFVTNTEITSDEVLYEYYNDILRHPYYSIFFWDAYSDNPCTTTPIVHYPTQINIPQDYADSLFELNSDNLLVGTFNTSKYIYNTLLNQEFFDNGFIIAFYLLRIPVSETTPVLDIYNRDALITRMSKLYNSRQLIKTIKEPSTYVEFLTEEPGLIAGATEYLSYTSPLGNHLVLYTKNKIFISQQGMQYYFHSYNTFSYPEDIVKVIQYKEMLLVFTTQNLYAVYLEEVTTSVQNGTDDEGNPKYVQQTSYEFRTTTVLYNLMVDAKYKDAIQVYNQMVLFYSSDGQMFLIKPTAAVDSETRFSIQYFNKSANDILLNYKDYMQTRLHTYGLHDIIKDVDIKVSVSINYIRIFYSAINQDDKPIMTYILIYDVINNRYYAYDTLAFSNIKDLHNIPSNEFFVIEHEDKLYFTLPYNNPNEEDNNVDISYYDNFNDFPINAEINTGTINLNNHLKKRFKDLHVTYKNLNTNDIEFSLATFVDDVPIITFINSNFEIRSIASYDSLIVVDKQNVTLLAKPAEQLIDQIALFNFSDYSSNKIITHKTSIISRGKTIKLRMYFKSKGKYKIQGFGLVYKEHTV